MLNSQLRRLCIVGICSLSFVAFGCSDDDGDSDVDTRDASVAEDVGEQTDTAEPEDTGGPDDAGGQQDASTDQDAGDQQDANGGGEEQLGWAIGDVPAAGEPAPIADLEFVNETEGYLTITSDDEDNVGIWYTDDAGETWEQRHSGQDPRAFAAAGESGPFWFGTFEGDYKFWSSEDGSSFSPMREVAFEGNPRHPDAGPEFGMTETADSVHFFDADNGIFTSTSASRIQYTDDGGQTWYSVDVDTDAGGLNQMDTAGDEVWIAGANSFGNDAGEGAYVVRSEDRGQTWQQVKGFVDDAHNFEGGGAQALYIADDQGDNVWVGGEARQLYFTEDGGESWNQVKEINDRVNTIWNIDGAGDVIVAVVSTELGSGILQSEDGGDTWELVVDREDEIFHDVEVVNEELAYAYTSDDPAGTNPGHWLVWDKHSTDNLVGLE